MAHVKRRATVALAVAALAVGCRGKSAEPAPIAEEPSARPAPVPELHEPNFDLVMKPAGDVVAGQPSAVDIQVDAKGGYHVNDKYPYKFKPEPSPGVTYAAPAFTAESAKLEEKRATMTVRFTPEGAGDKTIAGHFAFSLCSADQCLIEKRDVALHVAAR
jgi:hypothetical protein